MCTTGLVAHLELRTAKATGVAAAFARLSSESLKPAVCMAGNVIGMKGSRSISDQGRCLVLLWPMQLHWYS